MQWVAIPNTGIKKHESAERAPEFLRRCPDRSSHCANHCYELLHMHCVAGAILGELCDNLCAVQGWLTRMKDGGNSNDSREKTPATQDDNHDSHLLDCGTQSSNPDEI